MKQIVYILFIALSFTACTRNHIVEEQLQTAESLLSTHPDSAYMLLAACQAEAEHHGNRRQCMYHRLLIAEAMNKSYRDLTPDTLMHQMVRYFDRHGTANLRLRAYYALGNAYRDAKEAPEALHYYTLAIEKADTTRSDCDYATLYRVYGQMGDIYRNQNLPHEELKAYSLYSYYALMAKDTLDYIYGYERTSDSYYRLDSFAQVISVAEETYRRYMEYGYPQRAALVFSSAIYACLENKDYARARRYMTIFENESGWFDDEGNIVTDKEEYYNCQGRYYMGIGKLDSAEYYYRKLLPYEEYHYLAYEGLLHIYLEKKNIDSIAKYVPLYDWGMRYWVGTQQAKAIIHASAQYDYTRNQNIAIQKAEEAERAKYFNLFLISLVVAILLAVYVAYTCYVQYMEKKARSYRLLEDKYIQRVKEHKQLAEEYAILQQNFDLLGPSMEVQSLLAQKQQRIEQLEAAINQYKENVQVMGYKERMNLLLKNDIILKFRKKLLPVPSWEAPEQELWMELSEVYQRYMPSAYAYLRSAHFSCRVYNTCILVHLKFTTGEISCLLETSSQSVSNMKRKACQILFDSDESAALFRFLEEIENV